MTDNSDDPKMVDKKATFEEFKEFYKDNIDLDNTELYEEFPNNPKGTIRGWKTRIKTNIVNVQKQDPPIVNRSNDWIIKALCNDLGINEKSLDSMGLTYNQKLNFLQNKSIGKKLSKTDTTKTQVAGGIIPAPMTYGEDNIDYGIAEYITQFDGISHKITVEIPWTILFDPKKNAELGKRKKMTSKVYKKNKEAWRFA